MYYVKEKLEVLDFTHCWCTERVWS